MNTDWFSDFINSLSNLQLSEEQIGAITDALPMLALYQQGQQFGYQENYLQYQQNYLDYLNAQVGLSEQQLGQAQAELEFKNGPYWEWYVGEYFPAQQQMSADQAQMSTDQVAMSGNNVDISMNNVYQEQQRTKQAEMATQMAYAQAFGNNPVQRSSQTQDGRNVPGMLSYSLGYPGS